MLVVYIKKYRKMILASMFFFYVGCGITISLLHTECADAASKVIKKSESDLDKVKYIVFILSSPDNELKRNAIRTTWAQFASNIFIENGETVYKWNHTRSGQKVQQDLIKLYFVLGTQGLDNHMMQNLKLEGVKSKDLLLLDEVNDNYKNLAEKTLHALQWFSNNFKRLKYLIKCDDDSFVRIDLIVKDLEAFAPEMNAPELTQYTTYKNSLSSYKGLYWGYFHGKGRVYLTGKWQEKDWFLCDYYLPYALGGGYIISRSIVDYIAKNADLLSRYNSEDISMGVWTASLDGINRVHDIRFDTEWKSRGCLAHMLVRHKQTPKDMLLMYKTLVNSNGKTLCKTETTERSSYFYKWHVLPSVCCR